MAFRPETAAHSYLQPNILRHFYFLTKFLLNLIKYRILNVSNLSKSAQPPDFHTATLNATKSPEYPASLMVVIVGHHPKHAFI